MSATVEDRYRRLEDVEAVRNLLYRYHQICDGWNELGTHKDPEGLANLFTEDGSWSIPTPATVPDQFPAVGHDAIADRTRELQAIHWIIHFVVNPIVEIEGDEARGEFKAVVRVQTTPTSSTVWALGMYRADAVRTRDGWRLRALIWEGLSTTPEHPPALG